MPATGTRTSSSAICGCDSSTRLSPGAPGVRRLSRLRPRLRRRRPPRPSSSSKPAWPCWPWLAGCWSRRRLLVARSGSGASWRLASPRSWRGAVGAAAVAARGRSVVLAVLGALLARRCAPGGSAARSWRSLRGPAGPGARRRLGVAGVAALLALGAVLRFCCSSRPSWRLVLLGARRVGPRGSGGRPRGGLGAARRCWPGRSRRSGGLDGGDEVALAHLGGAADAHARGEALELGQPHGGQRSGAARAGARRRLESGGVCHEGSFPSLVDGLDTADHWEPTSGAAAHGWPAARIVEGDSRQATGDTRHRLRSQGPE